ncbi:MAG: amino acid permease [Pseudomonadota bacterium]|nr:amino acid permease [Pseudomonadota bacterium]
MALSKYMLKKPVALIQQESEKGELKRTLTAANLVSLGIGCIIGTGIFVMTGQAAAQFAGPAIILSFILAGCCCAFAALCYGELASMLPVSGSAYSYAYASLGEIFAWIVGWLLLLEYGIAGSTVAVGWSGYIVSFLKDFHIIVPPEWAAATGMKVTLASGAAGKAIFNLPAALGLSVVTMLLVVGVKESATVNNIIVIIKVAVILLFIAFGLFYITPANWHPFLPANTGEYGHFGWSGVFHGASYIFFAYVGFEAVSTAAQEARNPQRDVPIGIVGSLTVCTILYILVSLVLTGIVKYTTLDVPDPIAVAVDAIHLPWLAFTVKIGAICGLSSVMLVLMYGQTRIFYTMARDGLLPPLFSHVHPRFKTPWLNTILVGILSAVVAGMTPIEDLGDLVNLGTLMAFTIICFTVFYMRRKEPNLPRPFKVPFPKVTPWLGMAFCLFLISTLWATFVALIPYFILGFAIYFGYGIRHSRLRNHKASPIEFAQAASEADLA